jgi:hypothetical protein
VIHNRALTKIHRELVWALESARTRLAVAIAAETKSTPPDRWLYYMETADGMRRAAKRLRKAGSCALNERQNWIYALQALRRIPAQLKALRLCFLLREILKELGSALE